MARVKKETFCVVDIETGSATDIKRGVENYFADPQAHILVLCFKIIGEKEIHTVTNFERKTEFKIPAKLKNFKGTFIGHQWSFECTAFRRFAKGTRLADPAAWLCTQALAHRFNLPSDLASCADALKLAHRKNPMGRMLISKHSIPNKEGKFNKIAKEDEVLWKIYCEDDILPTEEIFLKLFPLWTPDERAVFALDRQINSYGIPIDVEGAKRIEKAYAKLMTAAEAEAEKLAGRTDGGALAINSPDGFKKFCKERGFPLPNARAETVEALKIKLENWPRTAVQSGKTARAQIYKAIELREILASRSVGKTDALLRGTSPDGRYRFGQIYHVAHTGRWQSWGANFYNFPRECVDASEWEKTLKANEKTPTLTGLISLQRGLIKAPKGKTFIVSDFAGIENRILLWLAGDTAQLARIAKGESPYLIFAEKLYPNEKVTKADTVKYTKAKAAVLGLGYHQGAAKFALMNGYSLEDAQHVVDVWRGSHPGVVKLWRDFDRAFRWAIQNTDDKASAEIGAIRFAKRKGTQTVTVTLPDGHTLYYRNAHLRASKKFEGMTEIAAVFGKSDVAVAIHGGVLTENIVQAIAARLLRVSMLLIDKETDAKIVLHVYDEIVTEVKNAKTTAYDIAQIMTSAPAWAKGLPLAVEQKITERWVK